MRNIVTIMACGSGAATAAVPTVDDSFLDANYNDDLTLDNFTFGAGQTFTSGGGTLDSVQFHLWKSASPTGNATAKLYALTGTPGTNATPTGSVLATSDVFDVSTLGASPGVLKTLNFTGANRYSLVAATSYGIVFEYALGSATNIVKVGGDSTSPADDGNSFYKTSGGAWALPGFAIDVIFYVYKV